MTTFTYDKLLELGAKAHRLHQIGQLQGHLLQSLREPDQAFQLGGLPFTGEDSKRLRTGLVRLLEEMSQEGRIELEANGVTFPKPRPAETPPEPVVQPEAKGNGQAHA